MCAYACELVCHRRQFGFDVMLDADAMPWLLEVNCDPSMSTESPLDLRVKSAALVEALNVVGLPVPLQATDQADGKGIDDAPNEFERWARSVSESSSDEAEKRQQWAMHLVNTEYERSRSTRWRRLFPGPRNAEYLPLLAAKGADSDGANSDDEDADQDEEQDGVVGDSPEHVSNCHALYHLAFTV